MKHCSKFIIIFIILFNNIAVARALGDIADTLFNGTTFLTKFFWAACIIMGIFLLTAAMVHYKEHRNNPKLIPMSTVITYFILALIAMGIPFLNRLFGSDAYDVVVNQSTL